MRQFKFLGDSILGAIYKSALNGDVRAARLYLESTGSIIKHQPNKVNQNNYIQVNKTILSQENVQHLSGDELKQMESIISGARNRVMGLSEDGLPSLKINMVYANS